MHPRDPDRIASHIPADVYRRAQREGRPIIIVHTTTAPPARRPARTFLVPLAVALAAVIGLLGTAAAVLALFDFAARTAVLVAGAAGPIGVGGLTFRLFHRKD